MVKPRRGSGADSIHRANDAEEAAFFARYLADKDPMVQKLMDGDGVLDRLPERHARAAA